MYRLAGIDLSNGVSRFTVIIRDRETGTETALEKIVMPMPGHHNALNATAAIAVAQRLGMSTDTIRKALAGFGGVKRRFTRTGDWNGAAIFDDYGHHPVEIAAVLRAARASTKAHVIAVVQPHRYTRLHSLFDGFAGAFNDADIVIVADVYPAGEAPIEGADRDSLVAALKKRGHLTRSALKRPEDLPRSFARWPSPAITSCVSAPAISRNGRRRCRASSRLKTSMLAPPNKGETAIFPDIAADLRAAMPGLRGALAGHAPLAHFSWFRRAARRKCSSSRKARAIFPISWRGSIPLLRFWCLAPGPIFCCVTAASKAL